MLKPNQTTEIKWCSRNKHRLINLGYKFTKMGDVINVPVEHLSHGSCSKIVYICDYCGAEITTSYNAYCKSHKTINKDACKKCASLKSREAFKEKYGVTNPLQVPTINKKQRETCVRKYGVEYALMNKDLLNKKNDTCLQRYGVSSVLLNKNIYDKKKQTCLKKYGCEVPSQNEVVRDKMERTCLERYGVKSPMQLDVFKQKLKNTFMERYGVEYCLQVPDFAHKARVSANNTMCKNHTIPTSKQQLAVYQICCEVYGEANVVLNKPLGRISLDIELKHNDCLIDIEYDGMYWHKDELYDRRRDEFVKSNGYKVLRIRGGHQIPTSAQIKESIDYLVKDNHTFAKINLNI